MSYHSTLAVVYFRKMEGLLLPHFPEIKPVAFLLSFLFISPDKSRKTELFQILNHKKETKLMFFEESTFNLDLCICSSMVFIPQSMYGNTHCRNNQRATKLQAQGKGNSLRSVVNRGLVEIQAQISGSKMINNAKTQDRISALKEQHKRQK